MKGREDIYTLRPLATLISSLRTVGISVYEPTDDDYIAISREQRVREVRFWNTNGMWHIGHDQRFTGPVSTLSTPDREVALRWLICCTGNLYRRRHAWPYLLPLRTVSDLATGWQVEQTSEQTVAYSIKATGRLIRPNGTPVAMDMTTTFPHAPELAALSHLMHLTPDQVLDAYLTPNGEPLNHLLEHGDPVTNQGADFKHLVSACAKHVTTYTDGFTIDWSNHFWLEDGCWHYGTTERGENRYAIISSPYHDLTLRWAAVTMLNEARRKRHWQTIFSHKLDIYLALGWTAKDSNDGDYGTLISPDGDTLSMVMESSFPKHKTLTWYSHLTSFTPEQIIDNFLLEDGGSFRNYLATPPSS